VSPYVASSLMLSFLYFLMYLQVLACFCEISLDHPRSRQLCTVILPHYSLRHSDRMGLFRNQFPVVFRKIGCTIAKRIAHARTGPLEDSNIKLYLFLQSLPKRLIHVSAL